MSGYKGFDHVIKNVCFFFVLFWDVLYHGQFFGFVSYNQLPIYTRPAKKNMSRVNPNPEEKSPSEVNDDWIAISRFRLGSRRDLRLWVVELLY